MATKTSPEYNSSLLSTVNDPAGKINDARSLVMVPPSAELKERSKIFP